MKLTDFLNKLNLAVGSHTVYATGAFGASIGNYPSQADRYYKNTLNRCGEAEAQKVKDEAKKPPCWAFDCCGLIKGVLWGWNAITNDIYGGANYESNGVPDAGAGASGLIKYCTNVSTDFSKIEAGEMLWLDGHVGVYIGDGMAIECTTTWNGNVQKVECWNVKKTGRGRKWDKHGKLPWVEYDIKPESYIVEIGEYSTKAKAEEMQKALKLLGTDSKIVSK